MRKLKVLIACEFSGTVRDAFIRAGHDATSADLLPTESNFGPHHQGNVLDILNEGWDLMIAHPPCTYLTNSGVQHLYEGKTADQKRSLGYKIDPQRWQDMLEGVEFFNQLQNANIPHKAIENPIMHKYARERVGTTKPQYVQPYEYGHPEQKRTGLRLINLPRLTPTNNVHEHMMTLPRKQRERVFYLSPGPNRWKERSRFFPGIADAMATQWPQHIQ